MPGPNPKYCHTKTRRNRIRKEVRKAKEVKKERR
jgi:hypothetical protein